MRLKAVFVMTGLVVLCAAAPMFATEWQGRSVLVIEADRPELPLYVAANEAFRATVRDASRQPVEVFLESLDLARFGQEGYLEEFENWVGIKYRGRRVDTVVALGPVAYRAAVRWRDKLWPGVPLVFGGVDRGTFEALGRVPDSTGALIEFGHLDSIRTALELLPATRHLAIVGGPPDRDLHAKFLGSQIAAAFGGRLEIIELSGLPMTEIEDRARKLPDHSIVIVTSFNIDGAGRVYTGQEVCALLAGRADRVSEWVLKIVGGVLVIAGIALLALNARLLIAAGWVALLTLAGFTAVALGIGHALGGPDREDRTALAVSCATRHVGIAMLAASAVPNPKTVAFVLAYLLSAALVTLPYLKLRARPASAGAARPGG